MTVSLQNLLKIGQLKEHQPDAAEVQRLLAAAARNLTDARVTVITDTGQRWNVASQFLRRASEVVNQPTSDPNVIRLHKS